MGLWVEVAECANVEGRSQRRVRWPERECEALSSVQVDASGGLCGSEQVDKRSKSEVQGQAVLTLPLEERQLSSSHK